MLGKTSPMFEEPHSHGLLLNPGDGVVSNGQVPHEARADSILEQF